MDFMSGNFSVKFEYVYEGGVTKVIHPVSGATILQIRHTDAGDVVDFADNSLMAAMVEAALIAAA